LSIDEAQCSIDEASAFRLGPCRRKSDLPRVANCRKLDVIQITVAVFSFS